MQRQALHLLLRGHVGAGIDKLPLLVLNAVVKVGKRVGDLGGRELHGRMKRVSGVELTLRASFLSKATFAFIFWDNAMSATPSLAAHWLSDARPFVWAERTSIVDFSACKNKHDLMSAQRKMLKAAISIVKKVELTLR